MPRKFSLQKGMFLIITRVLEFETPEVVAYSFSYKKIWDYWIANDGKEWDLALVRTSVMESPEGNKREIHQVWKILKPVPPSRYFLRLKRLKKYA